MKSVITNRKDLSSSIATFQKRIASLAHEQKPIEWAFPNGDKAKCSTYSLATDLGELLVAVPKKWQGRQAHLFALNYEGGTLAPDVEINIPDGLDRKVSGAYVRSGNATLICHRGGFTAYRGKIPKDVSLAHFEKWLISVDDEGRQASLISVAAMESNSLANDIAEFVSSVAEMKSLFKSGEETSVAGERDPNWHDGMEFEGKKVSGKSRPRKDYEYLHGPLCNALCRQLKILVKKSPAVNVLSNKNVDVAIVNVKSNRAIAIFEVKTSASLSGQLYSAHGQLAYYKHKYGGAETSLFLVLPKETEEEMDSLEFFKNSGVQVIYGEKESFTPLSGGTLSQVVDKCITA